MKRRRADRPEWKRITARDFSVKYLDMQDFEGYVTFLKLKQVSEPFWVENNHKTRCVADSGYLWTQHFPADAHHTQTTMFDEKGAPVQWYIDICKDHGVDEQGIPWFDDLYLDIVINPEGDFQLLDADELEEALADKVISQADYDLAWREAQRLLKQIKDGNFTLTALSKIHKQDFEKGHL